MSKVVMAVMAVIGLALSDSQGSIDIGGNNFVQSVVPLSQLVPVPGNTDTVLARVTIPHAGFWNIDANVNFYESAASITVFAAASINFQPVMDWNLGGINSSQIGVRPFNTFIQVPLPGTIYHILNDNTVVYLVMFSNRPGSPAPATFACGHLTAVNSDIQ